MLSEYTTCLKPVGKYRRQIFAAFAANMGAFSFGTAWSYTATALPNMRQDRDGLCPTEGQESILTSALFLGCIVSGPITGFCIEKFGRRSAMLLTNIPCVVAWIIIGFSTNIKTVYLGRFITGICSASYGSSAPLYVSETASSKIRGSLVCTFDTMIAAGMVFINVVGSFTSWRVQAFICGAIPLIAHGMLFLAPESPRYLMEKGQEQRARNSLMWFSPGLPENEVEEELVQISESCAKDKEDNLKYGLKVIFEPQVLKPLIVGCILMFFHQFCGNYPILAYGVSSFDANKSNNNFVGITTMNFAQLIASFVPVFFVDKLGRRPLLIISELLMGFILSVLGIYLVLQARADSNSFLATSTIPITLLVFYEMAYALGIGPLPWLLMGELVSPKRPGLSLGIITSFYRVLGFVQLYFFHDVVNVVGESGIYYFFSCVCILGSFTCYLCVPDTTGKTLEQIHNSEET